MKNAYTSFSTRSTPQREPVAGKDQVKNAEGGYVFAIDKWQRLERFLILGSEAPTYYVAAKTLTKDNANNILDCIQEDGERTVRKIIDISQSGRAPKNSPALFALALAMSAKDNATKRLAADMLFRVARIGTHLFEFVEYCKLFRGRGRVFKRALQEWYETKNAKALAYQVVKYQQREGWSHRDILRLVRPKPDPMQKEHEAIYKWIVKGESTAEAPVLIRSFEIAKISKKPDAEFVRKWGLTREMLPTEWLNDVKVWEALLQDMPMTAMIRNLGKMTSIGLLKPFSDPVNTVLNRLGNLDSLKKSKIHPFTILVALNTYRAGRGMRGKLTWDPVPQIIQGLEQAFYCSFSFVQATNKNWFLGVDVSSSMEAPISNLNITCAEAAAAMAMVTVRTEPNYYVYGFAGDWNRTEMENLNLHTGQSLDYICDRTRKMTFGGTDCSLPMLYALHKQLKVDVFVIYTDNETWAGSMHPFQALEQYRRKTGIQAKLIVCGMTATNFSIADPKDKGMLDVVGMDTSVPQLITDFAKQ